MMDIHAEIIKEGGRKFVKLPQAEFNRLMEMLEDAQDISAVRTAKKEIAAGEETLPAAMTYALADAAHAGEKIRIWREYRGLSKADLASTVHLTGQYIGMIEAGKRKGTIAQVHKIADALQCDMDDLV